MGVEMRVSMGEGEGRNEVDQQGATPLTVERRSAVYLRKDATEVSQENGGGEGRAAMAVVTSTRKKAFLWANRLEPEGAWTWRTEKEGTVTSWA